MDEAKTDKLKREIGKSTTMVFRGLSQGEKLEEWEIFPSSLPSVPVVSNHAGSIALPVIDLQRKGIHKGSPLPHFWSILSSY